MPPLFLFDRANAFPCDDAGCVAVVNEIGIEARVHAGRSELWSLVPDPLIGFALVAPPLAEAAVGVWHWAQRVKDGCQDDGLPELGALYVVDVLGCHGVMVLTMLPPDLRVTASAFASCIPCRTSKLAPA